MKAALVVGILVLLIGGFWYMQQGNENTSMSPSPTTAAMNDTMMAGSDATPDPNSVGGDAMVGEDSMMTDENGVKVVEMEAGSFYFSVKEIKVKKGDTVRVILNSVDMMHDFVIDELNVKSEVAKAGDSTTVEFTADQVGEFEYYCSVGQHRANGMVGKLIVEE